MEVSIHLRSSRVFDAYQVTVNWRRSEWSITDLCLIQIKPRFRVLGHHGSHFNHPSTNYMPTYHAVVWIDHEKALVTMFDREHSETVPIRAHNHHKHQGIGRDDAAFFKEAADALAGVHEVLLAGPGQAHEEFRVWCLQHRPEVAKTIVASMPLDHPTDKQLAALARKLFRGIDNMAINPTLG